jgi:PBP1b-binding outer membrane lipoprotein LpoB
MSNKLAGALGICTLALAGCVQSEDIVMKNPATGEIRECKTNSGPSFFPIAQTMIDNSSARNCAAGYEAAGWQRMN